MLDTKNCFKKKTYVTFLHFSRRTFFQFSCWILQKNKQNKKKQPELLMFSSVRDATVCIFVPVLEIKGVASVLGLHADGRFLFLLKAWLRFKTHWWFLTTRRRWGSAPTASLESGFRSERLHTSRRTKFRQYLQEIFNIFCIKPIDLNWLQP